MAFTAPKQPTKAEQRKRRQSQRERFNRARKAENRYARQLRQVAKQVGDIVKGFAPHGTVRPGMMSVINHALNRYSEILRPWAASVAEKFVTEISKRDAQAWFAAGREMGRSLQEEIFKAPTGAVMRKMMNEQVDLITSLPTVAAQRVHKLTVEAIGESTRASEIAKEILATGHVTASRADLIARTETGRTATNLTQSRALSIKSEGYFWRSSEDGDVRPEHRKLNGKFIRWDDPPVAGTDGMRYHAGAGPNCRCYPEPVIPDEV